MKLLCAKPEDRRRGLHRGRIPLTHFSSATRLSCSAIPLRCHRNDWSQHDDKYQSNPPKSASARNSDEKVFRPEKLWVFAGKEPRAGINYTLSQKGKEFFRKCVQKWKSCRIRTSLNTLWFGAMKLVFEHFRFKGPSRFCVSLCDPILFFFQSSVRE